MLARINYASQLSKSQVTSLVNEVRPYSKTADAVLSYFLDRLSPSPYEDASYNDLRSQGLLKQVLLSFSEFGRRAYENGSIGCDHGRPA